MLYLVIFLLVLLLLLFCLIRMDIIIEYYSDKGADKVTVTLSVFWGLIKHRINLSKPGRKKEKKAELYDKYAHIKQIYRYFNILKKYLRKRLIIKKLHICLEFGLGDASNTGIVSGIAWTLIGSVISVISSEYRTKNVFYNIKPDFSNRVFKLDFCSIFSIRIVNIIVVGLKMLWFFVANKRKFKKTVGGDLSG